VQGHREFPFWKHKILHAYYIFREDLYDRVRIRAFAFAWSRETVFIHPSVHSSKIDLLFDIRLYFFDWSLPNLVGLIMPIYGAYD